ncbi:Mechanosensitive ion channel protein 6 [Hibiscus syriacus]|uniref:Mechanosensitive ion channel protein n=1 Tax=Hibiscus syriacus TaxID=106335 RepID=A0A6A2XWV6_HIBSY|nr:Mechanosensitive ion channel protein 6 [Hibiscus syriacus]
MTVDTADRKEIILKIDDKSKDGGIPVSATATGRGKIWRESSYDFLKDSEKINVDWKKDDVDMNDGSSSSGSNSTRESEGFGFMQSKQTAMEDPPSKLIGQFLHKQKASGEISLDMDLEMDELQQQQPHDLHRGSLSTVAELPSPPAAATIPRVSFEINPVRRRQSKGSSVQRKSSLLATKTKSRLMDPPTPEKGEPKSARAGAGRSGQIMKSGFLGKHMEEEEDDPLLEEDFPDEYKKDKLSLLVLLECYVVVSTYFDRIQDSLFNQYVIETLSGPPLIEIQRAEEEEERLANEVMSLQKAGAKIPPGLRTSTLTSPPSARTIGSGRSQKSPRVKSPMLSRVLSSEKGEKDDTGITIDHLHKLNHKNVSAWNMRRLINIVRHGSLSTLDEQNQDSTHGDESASKIRNEREAKIAARRIFQNVSKPGSKFIYLEEIERFLQEDEALKTMSLFEDASESRRISNKALKNWVVNAFRERRAFSSTLNDTKTAVNRLHRVVDILVGIIIVIIWLLILEIATSKVLVFISSQLLLVAFIFGNTCKTMFEAIIFIFVTHPFDVGDRCEIDGIQMIVEEMNILTTVFLRYDNQKIIIPNSVLATKAIHNYYRSPDMGDAVEFCIHVKTPAEKIGLIKKRILSFVERKSDHWCPDPMIILKEFEELNRVRIAIWLTHKMNHQDMGERWTRRALLVEEMIKIFNDLDIKYSLYPVDINVCSMPPAASDRLPPNWTGPAR